MTCSVSNVTCWFVMNVSELLCILLLALFFVASGEPAIASGIGYQIGSGDVLKIAVYDNPDLTTVARVDDLGFISFPLIGHVRVSGQTASVAGQTIAARLAGDFIVNPQVSVFIEEFRSKKVVIIGEVVRPGLYELSGPTTLLEIISKAGGLTKSAGRSATIRRDLQVEEDRNNQFTINLDEMLATGSENYDFQLTDGDTITISKAGIIYVTGQVNRPAAYPLESDMTVIKAITLAGGFTTLAAQGRIKIIRKIDGKEIVLERVSLSDKIMADDVLLIPESYF